MTVLMSGINMYSMAVVMKVILGWNINFSILVSTATVGIYVALGGLLSAIVNEVVQFVLIWAGTISIPILGLIETGGWKGMLARIAERAPVTGLYAHVAEYGQCGADNPMGVHWTGIVFGLGLIGAFGYWTTDFLVVQRVMAARDLRSAKIATTIGAAFKMLLPAIVDPARLAGTGRASDEADRGDEGAGHRRAQLQRSDAAHDGTVSRSRFPGHRRNRSHRRLHVRDGGKHQRIRHGVDLRHLPPGLQPAGRVTRNA